MTVRRSKMIYYKGSAQHLVL